MTEIHPLARTDIEWKRVVIPLEREVHEWYKATDTLSFAAVGDELRVKQSLAVGLFLKQLYNDADNGKPFRFAVVPRTVPEKVPLTNVLLDGVTYPGVVAATLRFNVSLRLITYNALTTIYEQNRGLADTRR